VKLLANAHPLNGVQRLLLTVWVGGMWAIGYLAVPILFAALDSRIQAGAIAGVMFTRLAWIGLACGAVILLLQWRAGGRGLPRIALGCVLAMLVITAIGEFGVGPQMAALKAQVVPGAEMADALRARFGMWHGVSSSLFLLASMLGALAVWRALPPLR
jgi:hypothetical protein